jgi:hypothetical protein
LLERARAWGEAGFASIGRMIDGSSVFWDKKAWAFEALDLVLPERAH